MKLTIIFINRDKNLIGIKCLAQKSKPVSQDLTVTDSDLYKGPGLYISADKQCQMAYGPKFSYKPSQRTVIGNLKIDLDHTI